MVGLPGLGDSGGQGSVKLDEVLVIFVLLLDMEGVREGREWANNMGCSIRRERSDHTQAPSYDTHNRTKYPNTYMYTHTS